MPSSLEERDAAEHLLAEHRVRLHQALLALVERLGLAQDVVGDADLAHVVEQEAVLRARVLQQARRDLAGELDRIALHPL